MKKRILSILLLCCMVLTLLPTAAFAAEKIWVGTEEELLAALADNTIDKITLTADINERQPPHGGVGHRCKGGRHLHRLRSKHR